MARIYLTGSGQTKGHATGSGVISNPARILLQERDNHTGSYPTIARTGDPDFTGRYQSFYDDTSTVNFVGNSQTLFPMNLPASSKWVSGNVATPNILQGLTTVGTASKGVSDAHVSFTPGQDISPFNESRIYIDNDSSFYQAGIGENLLSDFDQKLGSKTIISLDINPSVSTDVFFSTGSSVNNSTSQIGSGLAYFNWNLKKWEMIGDTVGGVRTGSNVDILNPNPSIRSLAPHPAGGIPQFSMSSPLSNTARHVGIFHSTHGFPFATQYNSTGSQELLLTGVLSTPFLLEKATLEWSGSFASYPASTLEDGPLNYHFMLLNTSPVNDSVTISQDLTGSASGIAGSFITRNNSFTVTSIKDLVWAGVVSRYYSALTASAPPLTYERDLNLVKLSDDGVGIAAVTGTFRVESAAGIYGKNDGLHTMDLRGDTVNSPLLANKIGFRNFAGYVEGKSFISPIPGINSSGSFTTDGTDPSKKYTISFIPSSDVRKNSPYVLLPHHRLVLGFYGVPIQGTQANNGTWSEYSMRNHVTTLSPGAGKLTLYGSLLRGGLPVNSEMNQPLTSDAIHEDLHYDNPVYDQFDVEPFETLTGSYIDSIVTGSMLARPLGNPEAPNVRKVQASVVAGRAGTTGSLQRFVKLISENDLFYDTLVPSPADIASVDGFSLRARSGKQFMWFSNEDVGAVGNDNYVWWRSYPFESKYSNSKRQLANSIVGFDIDGSGRPFGGFFLTGSQFLQDEMLSARGTGLEVTSSYSEGLKSFFGIPRNFTTARATQNGASSEAIIAGFKYGLQNCLPMKTTANFRRDRYGQFRDMLDQAPNAAFIVENSVEYPVAITFFSRPSKDGRGRLTTDPLLTRSQNLSQFATSSLPYFDRDKPQFGSSGSNGVERSDDPDITLQPVKIDVVLV